MLSDRVQKLRLPSVSDITSADSPVELSWNLFLQTWEAARDDQHQMDFEVQEDASSKLRKKKGRRRKSVNVKHATSTEDDDDDEFVEGFAG